MPEWSEHLRPRLALLQLSAAREAEIIEELSQHLDQRYEELRSGGTSDADARRLAIEELLEPNALAKQMRSLRQAHVPSPITPGAPNRFLLGDFWQDLRYAARMLRKQPGFAAAAVLTLALGLGANIAIFSLVYGLLIRALPVDRPDELYRLGDTNNCCFGSGLQGSYSLFAFRLFEHLREATSDEFVELAAFQAQNPQPMPVRRGGEVATSLHAQYVSANYFQMFGLRPAAGRLLRPEDDLPGAEPVVVISHQAWTQQFGQDPSLVGSSILVYSRPMTVAGVAREGFFGDTVRPDPAALWIPLGQEPALRGEGSLIPHQVIVDVIGERGVCLLEELAHIGGELLSLAQRRDAGQDRRLDRLLWVWQRSDRGGIRGGIAPLQYLHILRNDTLCQFGIVGIHGLRDGSPVGEPTGACAAICKR